jgi:hypothetical protein
MEFSLVLLNIMNLAIRDWKVTAIPLALCFRWSHMRAIFSTNLILLYLVSVMEYQFL